MHTDENKGIRGTSDWFLMICVHLCRSVAILRLFAEFRSDKTVSGREIRTTKSVFLAIHEFSIDNPS